MLFEFRLEPLEQGKCVRGAASKTGDYLVLMKAANLARVSLEDRFPKGYLAVASDDDVASPANRENGGTFKHAGYFVEKRGLYTMGAPAVASSLSIIPASPGSRMCLIVNLGEVLKIHVGIDLSRADVRMAQQFLNRTQIS